MGSGQGANIKLALIVDKGSNVILNNQLTVNGKSVNDLLNNSVVKSQINVANGVAGLNINKEVTANINTQRMYTPFMFYQVMVI